MKIYKVTVPFACYKTGDIIQLGTADAKTFEKFIAEVLPSNKKNAESSNKQLKISAK